MKRKAKAKGRKSKAGKRVKDLTAKDTKQVKGGKANFEEIPFTSRVNKASPLLF